MLKRIVDGEGVVEPSLFELATLNGVSREQVQRMAEDVEHRVTRQVQRLMLSRGGLADLVAGLADAHAESNDGTARSHLTALVIGPHHAVAMLAARAAKRTGLTLEQTETILPAIIAAQLRSLAARARPGFHEVFSRMPSLFGRSLGSMHADMSDIIRRRCGAGPFSRSKLRHRVREAIAEAGGFAHRGAWAWYARQASSPAFAVAGRLRRALTKPLA